MGGGEETVEAVLMEVDVLHWAERPLGELHSGFAKVAIYVTTRL